MTDTGTDDSAPVFFRAFYTDFTPMMHIFYIDKVKYPEVSQEFRFELQGENQARQLAESREAEDVAGEPMTAKRAVDETMATKEAVTEQEEPSLDPMVLEFLDADSYEQRLNILAALKHRVTDDMITTMAIACGVEVSEGSLEERLDSLKSCLLTLDKYECNRLR